MVQYILEAVTFQLVFLIIYDLWLKRETFFQWNRAYLIGTYMLSMALPWINIEAFKTTVPETYYAYTEFLWNTNDMVATGIAEADSATIAVSWEYVVLFGGMFVASLFFAHKIRQLYLLKSKGEIQRFSNYTQILIANSQIAFSFFKSIFMGDKVFEGDYKTVIAHELVHIKQKHTYDLLFFELMRIACWFNPLVYVYQSRVAELHEFIADAQVAKTNKKEHYQILLSQVFETQHISFINQFFKSSLIKKRIVMLQKPESKRLFQFKYLVLIPFILGMLFYTSCETEAFEGTTGTNELSVADVEILTEAEESVVVARLTSISKNESASNFILKDDNTAITFSKAKKGSNISGPNGELLQVQMSIDSKVVEDFSLIVNGTKNLMEQISDDMVPFAVIDEIPVFPGCENDTDQRACFQTMIQKHISKNFRYPEEAQNKGIQGRVSAMFVITKDGTIKGLRMKGPDKLLEEETARIIARLPKMIPGRQDGEAVNVPFSIPITFKLRTSESSLEGDTYEDINEANATKVVPYATVYKVPIFPGCDEVADQRLCFMKSLQEHISKNFSYPQEAREKGVQGRVSVIFTIGKDGGIVNVKMRGPDKLLENEALRIISKLPKMKPGKNAKGESVSVPFSIPITFKLDKEASTGNMEISGSLDELVENQMTGIISDGKQGLPGVNILVKNTNKTAVTDFDGNFTISAQPGDEVVLQYKGLPTTTMVVNAYGKFKISK